MAEPELAGRRVLVIGASSGIGRAIAAAAADGGARVVVSARREPLLAEVANQVGGAVTPIPCDVRTEDECRRAVTRAVETLGGLDAVVYAVGTSPLQLLTDADADLWRDTLATNVVGAAQIARYAHPHLAAAGGRFVVLSSNAVERPFPGLGVYVTSKAALDAFVTAWRADHPEVPITRVVVGPTLTAGLTSRWDPDLAAELFERWQAEGHVNLSGAIQPPEAVARQVVQVLAADTDVTDVRVMPRRDAD